MRNTTPLKTKLTSTTIYLVLLAFTDLLLSASAIADSKSDRAKEKRWEEQIVPGLIVGEEVKLNAGGIEFLALYTESTTDEVKGAVIIMHGIGVHPAWTDVIEPLRISLPDHGWNTLSLQMPILKNEAENKDYPPLFPEVPGRIQAGVDFLKSKGIKNIILSGHSLGSTMGTFYMSEKPDPAVSTFIIVSGGEGYPPDARMNTVENFKKIKNIKILDIHGSEDTDNVRDTSTKRNKLGPKLFGKNYESMEIKGANHFYQGKQDELTSAVTAWIDKISGY